MRPLLRLSVSAFLLQLSSFAFAAPLAGTKSVGPTGDYASLTAAIADVNAVGNGLGGALVLELQASYVSTVETFPLTIPALTGRERHEHPHHPPGLGRDGAFHLQCGHHGGDGGFEWRAVCHH